MNEMIKIQNEMTIGSRDVAQMLEKRHADLLRDIKKYIGYFNERKIALVEFFVENQYVDTKGENRLCYDITKKGCEFLAHKLTGEKGAIFTATYINRFHEMEKELNQNVISVPTTFADALLLAYQQQLKIDEQENQLKEKDSIIAIQEPKAEYYDELVDKNHLLGIRESAKSLQIKERIFVKALLEKGYLYRDKNKTLRPYAQYIPKLFQLKNYQNSSGYTGVQTFITVDRLNILRKVLKLK